MDVMVTLYINLSASVECCLVLVPTYLLQVEYG